MIDDLGSLSEQGLAAAESASRGREQERWKWLHPWAWVSGMAWGGGKAAPLVDLTLQIYGSGLEHCSSVQVCHT